MVRGNSVAAKRCVAVLATLDLLLMAIWCVGDLTCEGLKPDCQALWVLYLIVSIVCLICIYVELCTGNARLYWPYYAFLQIRINFNLIGFVFTFGGLVSSNFVDLGSGKSDCVAFCSCKCAPSNSIEAIVLAQRSVMIHFFMFLWCLLIFVLISVAVPDAVIFFYWQAGGNRQQQVAQPV